MILQVYAYIINFIYHDPFENFKASLVQEEKINKQCQIPLIGQSFRLLADQ